jgi:hypothetical protein
MNNLLAYIFAAALLLGGQTLAAEATGIALAVDTDARVELGSNIRMLTAGDDLAIGETVVTDDHGLVQIKFSDDTQLVVGPNSQLLLEDYLLRSDGSVGKLAINALAGSFRFVTGNSNKDDYSIKTPNGTIGIRGTAFDFFVGLGVTRVLMYHGTAILCGTGNACVTMAGTCEVGQTDSTQSELLGASFAANGSERETLRQSFRYADNQQPLLEQFRLDQVPECQLAGPSRAAAANVAEVVGICGPVIAEQYSGDVSSWGECGAAVAGYLAGLDVPADEQIAELAAALAELFEPGPNCSANETELPESLYLAALRASGVDQQQAIREIADSMRDCEAIQTASIQRTEASPN